ncbi:MAG TPA: hypothetical protein VII74_09210 [Chthoniobacterales bacterium]
MKAGIESRPAGVNQEKDDILVSFFCFDWQETQALTNPERTSRSRRALTPEKCKGLLRIATSKEAHFQFQKGVKKFFFDKDSELQNCRQLENDRSVSGKLAAFVLEKP